MKHQTDLIQHMQLLLKTKEQIYYLPTIFSIFF